MNRTQPPSRHRARTARRHTARWLTAVALSGLAVAGIAGTPAQAAHSTAPARAAVLGKPAPIAINTTNWSGNAGFGSRSPAWYTDGSGVVHLQGAASQISTSGINVNIIGTLPAAARPASAVFTVVHTFEGTYTGLGIDQTGRIFVLPVDSPAVTDYSFVSLEGITFHPSRPGTTIKLNAANWSLTSGPGARTPAWYADRSGVVHLQGAAHQTSASGANPNLIGTLPAAARPTHIVYTIVGTSFGSYADLAIGTDGTLRLIDPRAPAVKDYSVVSLESLSYRPAKAGTAIAVNTANWTPSAGFGSRSPAWYTDRSGIVHLQGAASQTSASGSNANLIGTLPAAARPAHIVYVIAHTFTGTYTDLAIGTDGTLRAIPTRPPLATDYTFVSLESITYRR